MLVHQELRVNKGKVTLRNVTDDDKAGEAARDARCGYASSDNPKGYNKGKTMAHVAAIPPEIMFHDPMCLEFMRLRSAGNMEEARRVLRVFLQINPQFRASSARV